MSFEHMVKDGLQGWAKLCDMIVSDDEAVHRRGVQYFLGVANNYLSEPYSPSMRAGLQEFAVSGAFPTAILEIIEKFPEFKEFDMGYEAIFNIRDYRNSGESGFKIRGVANGMAFSEVPVGAKAKTYGISGTDVTVNFALYGSGLDLHKTLFDDKDYYSIAEALQAFRGAEGQKRALAYYGLIEAVGTAQNTAFAGATGDTEAEGDVKTINSGCGSIMADLEDKGYELGMNPNFIMLVPDTAELRRRTAQALNVTGQAYAGSPTLLSYNVTPIFTQKLVTETVYYIILPKRKLVGGNRMDLTLFNEPGILSYSETIAGWARYGGAVGESKQVRRCALS